MTIRVAFVLPHLRAGGAERAVVNWIGALDRSRFAPLLLLKRVEGEFLSLLPDDVTPISLGGARALHLPGAIARALAEYEVDVAYSATNAMNLALLRARTGAARIVSEHTPPVSYLAEAKASVLRRLAMRHFYRRADVVAVPTARIGEELSATLGRPISCAVVPNPVVGGAAAPAPRKGPIVELLSAGRLVPAKGFDTLIDAVALLAQRGAPVRLRIAGEGPERAALQARIDQLRLADRVTLLGHVPDLSVALSEADLFVLASRREGFGNVLVEAMAAGVPVLATRSGGPETFIVHGSNGFLSAPGDATELAVAIAALLANPVATRAVTPAAQETARGYSIAGSTRVFEGLVTRVATRSMAA